MTDNGFHEADLVLKGNRKRSCAAGKAAGVQISRHGNHSKSRHGDATISAVNFAGVIDRVDQLLTPAGRR